MTPSDSCVSIHPYFQVPAEKLANTRAIVERLIAIAQTESGCLYYGFSLSGNLMHCREGYANAEGLLIHLQNVEPLIEELLGTGVTIERLEVHCTAKEIEKLRGPMADLAPRFFVLECGFRK